MERKAGPKDILSRTGNAGCAAAAACMTMEQQARAALHPPFERTEPASARN